MTLPVAITDHVAQGLALLLSQFDESPRLRKLVEILLTRVQELEDWQQDVASQLNDLQLAIGVQLDRHGRSIGELRNALTDVDYRRVILARGVANQSETDHETILRITRLVADTADEIRLIQNGRAHFRLEIDMPSPLSAELGQALVRLIILAKPIGVSCVIVEAVTATSFRYDVGPGYDTGTYASVLGSVP